MDSCHSEGKGGLLLIIAIKCMPVSISLLGDKHDGLTALYRKATWFANYLNRPCHFIQLLGNVIARVRGLCLPLSAEVQSSVWCISPPGSNQSCKLFNVVLMGISKLVSTWWRHKNAWWVSTQCEDGNILKKKKKRKKKLSTWATGSKPEPTHDCTPQTTFWGKGQMRLKSWQDSWSWQAHNS